LQVDVGAFDELPEAVPRVVSAAGREVVLVRWRGAVHALRNLCPHMSQSFDLGTVRGKAGGEVGEVVFAEEQPVLSCPWHQYQYDLASGQCLVDRKLRVRRYPATVQGGRVLVEMGR
jgi:3-phenylpropionate/trans-cinnamate dioxygenase ferredoxin subunit